MRHIALFVFPNHAMRSNHMADMHVTGKKNHARSEITFDDGTCYLFRVVTSMEDAYLLAGSQVDSLQIFGAIPAKAYDYLQALVRRANPSPLKG